MRKKILELCEEKGFFLNKEMLDFFSNLKKEDFLKIIDFFSNLKIKEKVITKKIFNKYKKEFEDISVDKYKKDNFKILSEIEFSSKKIKTIDFIKYFRYRYTFIKEILEYKGFNNLISIRKIDSNNGIYSIIGMVYSKKLTKNKNLLVEIEDLTGRINILINKENKDLFNKAQNLLLDDIVVFEVSGSNKMLFVNNIIYPDSELEKEKYGKFDEYIAFVSDFHVGSKMFLEKNLLKFISWLNGEIGDVRSKKIAQKIKYLFIVGDNIDGVGVYPNQENFLKIKTVREQYKKLAEILKKIREDIQIIMCPGQHDSVWVGEPQKKIPEKWSEDLYKIKNLTLISNPALIEINEDFKILMYHGASINRFINEFSEIRLKYKHNSPTKIIKEILKRRHLSSIYGKMDNVPYEKDFLLIEEIPDIIVSADQHRAEVDSYNNILMVSTSCWQSKTPFEEKVGNNPDPCKVPLFNLKTREVKIIDFGYNEVKLDNRGN